MEATQTPLKIKIETKHSAAMNVHLSREITSGLSPGMIFLPLSDDPDIREQEDKLLPQLGDEGTRFIVELNELRGISGVLPYKYGMYVTLNGDVALDDFIQSLVAIVQKFFDEKAEIDIRTSGKRSIDDLDEPLQD